MARSVVYTSDTAPTLDATLRLRSGGVLDGTGHANPQFKVRRRGATTNLFAGTGIWITPAAGTVRYTLAGGDLATAIPGVYDVQWVDTDGGGKIMHLDGGELEIRTGF